MLSPHRLAALFPCFLLLSAGALAQANQTKGYEVQLGSLQILQIRSAHNDTLWASIRVAVNGTPQGTMPFDGGNGRNAQKGLFPLHNRTAQSDVGKDVAVNTGAISDTDVVTVSFLVANLGHPANQDVLDKGVDDLQSGACKVALSGADDSTVSDWICAATHVTNPIVHLFTINCDGVVAADTFTLTGKQLRDDFASLPRGSRWWNWHAEYQGKPSPHECGQNSDYRVNIHFTPR
jgi:hypothetical protein